jgi:hypothetical protein
MTISLLIFQQEPPHAFQALWGVNLATTILTTVFSEPMETISPPYETDHYHMPLALLWLNNLKSTNSWWGTAVNLSE